MPVLKISSLLRRLPLDPLITTKQQVLAMLYVTYIWDSVRNGYIESCKKEYLKYCNTVRTLRRSENYEVVKDRYTFSSIQYEGKISHGPMEPRRKSVRFMEPQEPNKRKMDLLKSNIPIGSDFNCPIPEMPKMIRLYQTFSTVFMFCATIKYIILMSMHYGWISIDPIYSCYLPGRLGLMVNFSDAPWFGLFTFSLHFLFRMIPLYFVDHLDLDCFVFLCYDEDTILDKQYKLTQLNDARISPEVAYRNYLCDKVFYEQQVDAKGRIQYVMKRHRTIEQYNRFKYSVTIMCLSYYLVMIGIFLPMYIYGFVSQLSHDNFERSYPSCRSFSNSPSDDFRWSFGDKFRIFGIFFDLLDNSMYVIDTSVACVLPFSAALILAYDLSSRFDTLCNRISQYNDRLRSFLINDDDLPEEMNLSMLVPLSLRFVENLERASTAIFSETRSIFNQVQQVDRFMKGFTVFSIYVTFSFDAMLQSIIYFNIEQGDSLMVVYLIWEVYVNIVVGLVFVFWARPNTKARHLYTKICTAMALCPSAPQTKISWRWLLEYYHKRSSRFSLHIMSQSFPLSTLNYIRCMSWFLTGMFIVLNLVKERQQLKHYANSL